MKILSPWGSWKCAGCIVYSGSGCQKCGGGFISRSGWCTSCADTTGWTDRNGLTCAQISTSQCNDVKVKGLSSNEACCKCHWVQRDEILHSSHEFVHPVVILLTYYHPVVLFGSQMARWHFKVSILNTLSSKSIEKCTSFNEIPFAGTQR